MDNKIENIKNMSNEERLLKVFANVNDWLKFAEAKNAMIIALNAASIYGIAKAMNLKVIENSEFLSWYLFIVIIQLVFSTVCALISFAPRVKIIKGGLFAPGSVSNVLFFEYLKTKSSDEIIREVNSIEKSDMAFKPTLFETDVAVQIQQNSIIASRKYSYFAIAVWLTISAYITLPLALIFCLYTYLSK